jgi:hypothetical protein
MSDFQGAKTVFCAPNTRRPNLFMVRHALGSVPSRGFLSRAGGSCRVDTPPRCYARTCVCCPALAQPETNTDWEAHSRHATPRLATETRWCSAVARRCGAEGTRRAGVAARRCKLQPEHVAPSRFLDNDSWACAFVPQHRSHSDGSATGSAAALLVCPSFWVSARPVRDTGA